MEELGCGTAGHDPACLCDVVITNPLPPLRECFRDAVQELGMGARVAEVRGYGVPWTDDTILDFLCDVQRFWDAWHERLENGNYSQLCDVPPVKLETSMTDSQKWAIVRDSVVFCMNRFDHPLVTILEHLGVSADMFMRSATQNKSGGVWTMSNLDLFDKEMMSETLVFVDVAEKFSLSKHTVRGLHKYWEERRNRMTNGVKNPARAMMQRLCRDTNYPPSKIVEMVKEAHGITYARSSVSKCRQRQQIEAGT